MGRGNEKLVLKIKNKNANVINSEEKNRATRLEDTLCGYSHTCDGNHDKPTGLNLTTFLFFAYKMEFRKM